MDTLLLIIEWVAGFFINRKKDSPNVALDEAKAFGKPVGTDDATIDRL